MPRRIGKQSGESEESYRNRSPLYHPFRSVTWKFFSDSQTHKYEHDWWPYDTVNVSLVQLSSVKYIIAYFSDRSMIFPKYPTCSRHWKPGIGPCRSSSDSSAIWCTVARRWFFDEILQENVEGFQVLSPSTTTNASPTNHARLTTSYTVDDVIRKVRNVATKTGWICHLIRVIHYTRHNYGNIIGHCSTVGWWRSTVVERRSLTGELSLSCARPAADGWPLMWV